MRKEASFTPNKWEQSSPHSPEKTSTPTKITSIGSKKKDPPIQDEKIRILSEILANKDDNDPRLDKEFNHLSSVTKRQFQEYYASQKHEKFNERGTLVFLIGKNLSEKEDFEFLKKVIDEPACKSLEDCKKEVSNRDTKHLQREAGLEITLAYPQVVALKSIENFLKSGSNDRDLIASAQQVLELAKSSSIPVVSRMALELSDKL